jgi:hypothetical protein
MTNLDLPPGPQPSAPLAPTRHGQVRFALPYREVEYSLSEIVLQDFQSPLPLADTVGELKFVLFFLGFGVIAAHLCRNHPNFSFSRPNLGQGRGWVELSELIHKLYPCREGEDSLSGMVLQDYQSPLP